MEAIEVFERAYNRLGLTRLICQPISGRLVPMTVGPTRISVGCDLITRKPVQAGRDRIGGVIFLFSRGEASTTRRRERCKIIAGLIYMYAIQTFAGLGDADRSICLAIDVFNGVAHAPAGTFTQRMRHVEDACDEIATRWRTVDPPSDYDGPDPG